MPGEIADALAALLYRNVAYRGTTDSGMGASTTNIDCADFIGFGDDYFNTGWYMQIVHNTNSVGNAPEGEVRDITDFDDGTGEFIVDAFTTNVEAGDEIIILHESLVAIGRNDGNNVFDSSNVSGNADGSALERLEQLAVDVAAVDAPVSTASATAAGTIKQDSTSGTPDVVTCSIAALNTFTAYTQVDASLSADSWISHVSLSADTTEDYCIEIAKGGGTSEVAIARFSTRLIAEASVIFALVPIKVTSGTRISVRASSSASGGFPDVVTIGVSYYQGLET